MTKELPTQQDLEIALNDADRKDWKRERDERVSAEIGMNQKPKIEGVLPVQKEIINKLVAQIDEASLEIMERLAKGDIDSEVAKKEIISAIDRILIQPFKHKE